MSVALLVIDVQNALIEEGPFACDEVVGNIKRLLDKARAFRLEVIYVQHIGQDGSVLEEGSDGWKIYDKIAPEPGEVVISKRYNSSFRKTELKKYLDDRGIDRLIITGMQTEYCIDTSCKVAFEYGYSLIVPEMTNTTYDNGLFVAEDIYKHYNHKIFKDRFAVVETVDNTIEKIEGVLAWD